MKVVVLLSGGLDSSVVLAEALEQGHIVLPLTFDYGQRNRAELKAAYEIAHHYDLRTKTIKLPLVFGSSALTNDILLPKGRTVRQAINEIPTTYVPCRNTVFISVAASYAEAVEADEIWLGFNFNDKKGRPSPDGRAIYLEAMQCVLDVGTRRGVAENAVRLVAPFIQFSKEAIIDRGVELQVPMALTRSCYADTKRPCARCDACVIRAKAFRGLLEPRPPRCF